MWTLAQYTKRRYKLCNLKNEIGDEFHYLYSCFILITKENSALKNIYKETQYSEIQGINDIKINVILKNNVDFKTL